MWHPRLLINSLLAWLVGAKITGVWTDIENHAQIVGTYLRDAAVAAHTAGLRLAADAQVGWAFEANTVDPTRPVHQQVMDIVDEITLMDYFTSCSNTTGHCDPMQAMYLAAPWLTYAEFLHTSLNRSVLLDVGVSMGGSTPGGQPTTELELENFFKQTDGFLRGQVGGNFFHNLAVFGNGAYRSIARSHPCSPTESSCGPTATRPTRAVWWYGLFGSSHVHSTWRPINSSAIAGIVQWCTARHVTELYVDQFGIGEYDPTSIQIQASWEAFVKESDLAGIDLLLYVGDSADTSVTSKVKSVATWCLNHTGVCGPRVHSLASTVLV